MGYIPGIFDYVAGRKENKKTIFTPAEKVVMGLVVAAGMLALIMVATGLITF